MTVHQEFQAVILAAGKGSRMPELTAEKPKCLLPIGNKPMVYYPLLKLQQSGFKEAILIVCETQKPEIQAVLEKTDLEIKIEYATIADNEELGTADSLRLIQDRIKADIIVLSCDLITNVDLFDVVHVFRKHDATICSLLFNPQESEQIVVPGPKTKHTLERDLIGVDTQTNRLVFLASASDFESEVTLPKALIKKHTNIKMHSNFVDSHLYIMKNWVLRYLLHESNISTLKGEFLPHIIRKQLTKPAKKQEHNVSIVDVKDTYDIFHFVKENKLNDSIREASSYNDHHGDMKVCYHGDLIRCYAFIAKRGTFGVRVNTLPTYWSINSSIFENWEKITNKKSLNPVDAKADVKSNQVDKCFLWDSCVLKEKTSFRNTIIGSNSTVNSFSRVFNSIVMNNVNINEKVAIENCIVCDGAVIENNCQLKGCLIGSNHTVKEGSIHNNEVLTDSDRLMEF